VSSRNGVPKLSFWGKWKDLRLSLLNLRNYRHIQVNPIASTEVTIPASTIASDDTDP
jgi:hypothetical protein